MRSSTFPLFALALWCVATLTGCSSGTEQRSATDSASAAAAASAALAGARADEAILASMQSWSYFAVPAPMSNGGINRIATIGSVNNVNFGFPYNGEQSATLHIRKNADGGGCDVFITIDKGQLLSGEQGDIVVKVDNDTAMRLPAASPNDNSTTALFIDSSQAFFPPFLARLEHAKTLKMQVTAYQNGNPVFVFNVAGFSLAKLDDAKPANSVAVKP